MNTIPRLLRKNFTFKVNPVSDIDTVLDYFGWYYPWLSNRTVKLKGDLLPAKIQFVKAQGTRRQVRDYIGKLGFIPAGPEYLLGFVQSYPQLVDKYRYVVSIGSTDDDLLQGEMGNSAQLCFDWHDQTELRLLSSDKKIGQSWWIPVFTNSGKYPKVKFEEKYNFLRSNTNQVPNDFFYNLSFKEGIKVIIDEDIKDEFYNEIVRTGGWIHNGAVKYKCFSSDVVVNDYQIINQFKPPLSSISEIITTAYEIISDRLKKEGFFYDMHLKGYENLNLGYMADDKGIKVIYLEFFINENGTHCHIHSEYICRLYKSNRNFLIEYLDQD